MKKSKDTKQLLFETMAKVNPDFNLTEAEDKWIQKAVDPKHKGYCTPMSKPTCTPRRKALARRFKKGIDEDVPQFSDYDQNNPQFKDLAEKIKAVVDDLYETGDYDILQTIYKLVVNRGYKFIPKSSPAMSEGLGGEDYKITAERLKGKIDFLRDNGHEDILDKIDEIISKLFPVDDEPEAEIAEAPVSVPQQNNPYFETLSATLDAVRERVGKKGYSVDEDQIFTQFGTGGISYGQTKRATIGLINTKTGLQEKHRSVTIAIYRMDSGKYELTAYLN